MNAVKTPLGGGLGFRVGETIVSAGGAYRIRGFLGRGGMAHVLEVEDESLGKRFALKILDAHLAEDPASVERFEREARALAKLDHPHLVAVVRLERTRDKVPRPFFLMERLRGGTLRDHLNRGPVAVDRTLGICGDLLSALDYVHERKLLHRDVKPSNVFVHVDAFGGERGKLLDFGVMKLLLEQDATPGFFGTAHYAAPEQLESGHILGPPSDVYGAGIVLFETLSGTHPFATQERTPRGARDARLRGVPSLADAMTPDRVPGEVLEELTPLCAALLSRDPLLRPSAGTASRALARIARKLASLRAENEHVLSARTAVPLPFLPGHLAAPTEIDAPRPQRAAFQTVIMGSHTVPMPPPSEDRTESVADAELLPTRPVLILVPPPPRNGAACPPPLSTTRTMDRALLPMPPTAHHGPNGTERLEPEQNPMHRPAPNAPPSFVAPPNAPGLGSAPPTGLSLATKVLLAVAVVALVVIVGIAGRRPRSGHAHGPSSLGVAAGTSSPGAGVTLHAL